MKYQNAGEYDQEMPESQTIDQPKHGEEEPQSTFTVKRHQEGS